MEHRIQFWVDTDSGQEVEIVAEFSGGVMTDLDAYSYTKNGCKPVTLTESELERIDNLAIEAFERGD